MSAENFGKNLDHARKDAGMTLRDVAVAARTSITYVHRVCAGDICPTLLVAERLAKAVGKPLAHLVSAEKKVAEPR